MTSSPDRKLTRALRASTDDILRYFLRRLEPEDAADALAEVMSTAWKRIDALPEPPTEARMWLFGVARNVLLHSQRGLSRRADLAERLRRVATLREAPGADTGSEVRDAISRLDDSQAELVRLIHWDGFAVAEAAQLLGIPASTARGRYQKAKEALREALSPVSK
ncbi:RNA polymerase sigma factor [Microbacterium sp. NPDC016588]